MRVQFDDLLALGIPYVHYTIFTTWDYELGIWRKGAFYDGRLIDKVSELIELIAVKGIK